MVYLHVELGMSHEIEICCPHYTYSYQYEFKISMVLLVEP